MIKFKLTKEQIFNISIFITLFCVYILPVGLIKISIPIDKAIFSLIIFILYFYYKYYYKKLKFDKAEKFFIITCLILSILCKSINYLLFITILFAKELVENKRYIIKYLKKSNILYFCLGFTILYSLMNFGRNNRYMYTAIFEINQSGLAIFCLSLMLMLKNKKIGYFIMFLGLLTVSRSYYLAVIIYMFSHIKIVKKILNTKFLSKCINHFTVFKSIMYTNLLLVLLGIFYLIMYKNGNIFWGDEIKNRLYNLLDYSNYFRFITNLLIILTLYYYPKYIFLGMSNDKFNYFGKLICENLKLPYKFINPHNLFFSHLKQYGLFVFVELLYISKVIKKLVNKNNFLIYVGIIFYTIFLGAGLYSYWLYLTIFVLIINDGDESNTILIKNNLNNNLIKLDDNPLVTVIMSVYKEDEEILSIAIESILNQTYKNIEFIIILDNPQGKEQIECIKKYKDKRIRFIMNKKNIGLVKSLNKGIKLSTGRYIARMDADDISFEKRIEKQMLYLKEHSYDLCGVNMYNFYNNKNQNVWKCPVNPIYIKKILKFQTPIGHPTWLGRKEVFTKINGYREIFSCEDYDFLLRANEAGFIISNVPEILFKYRLNPKSISRTNSGKQELLKRFLASNYQKNRIVKLDEVKNYINSKKFKKRLKRVEKYTIIKDKRVRNRSNVFLYYFYTFKMFLFIRDVLGNIKNKLLYNYIMFLDGRNNNNRKKKNNER